MTIFETFAGGALIFQTFDGGVDLDIEDAMLTLTDDGRLLADLAIGGDDDGFWEYADDAPPVTVIFNKFLFLPPEEEVDWLIFAVADDFGELKIQTDSDLGRALIERGLVKTV